MAQPPNITARRSPPRVRQAPAAVSTAAQNSWRPRAAGMPSGGMSPPKIRRGMFCMAPKGLSWASCRRPSGKNGRGTTAPPSRSAAAFYLTDVCGVMVLSMAAA